MLFGALFVEFIRISWGPGLVHLFSRVTSVTVNTHAPGSPLVIYGGVLLLVLFVAPAGIAGLLRRIGSLRGARHSSFASAEPIVAPRQFPPGRLRKGEDE